MREKRNFTSPESSSVCLLLKFLSFDNFHFTTATTTTTTSSSSTHTQGVVGGYNGTVFAYGQTGCGKSFSMQGIETPSSQRGIIPRAFQHIFESVSVSCFCCCCWRYFLKLFLQQRVTEQVNIRHTPHHSYVNVSK